MQLYDKLDWPPDPAEIDLDDPDWLSPQKAALAAKVTDRTIWRAIASRPISVKICGRVWVSKRRLMGG